MEHKEIVKRITGYCKQGLLDGVRVSAFWCGTEFTMQNVNFDGQYLRFDQDRRKSPDDAWEASARDAFVENQCQPWLEDILHEIEKIVSVDRNLF